jgi:hypothetical protein
MPGPLELTGKRFARLFVIKRVGAKRGRSMWLCACDCGNQTVKVGLEIKSGRTKSCGCWQRSLRLIHGMTRTTEYQTRRAMIARCHSPKSSSYARYGGRGIRVCQRWLDSFQNFLNDMGKKPHPNLSLERVDNTKGYSKDNCVWATASEQQNNRRVNRIIEFNGESHTATQWSRILGIGKGTIFSRLKRGMPVEMVLSRNNFKLSPRSRSILK